MNFHIADSFTAALARLTGQEQKQVKTAAFDLQLNPSRPGLQMHRLTNGRDPNFWSVRVNQDMRIIIHKTEASFMLAYVDHHDDAYAWAARRRIEAHPRTGSIQIVEVLEQVEQVAAPSVSQPSFDYIEPAQPAAPAPLIFTALSEEDLLDIGTPPDWAADILGWTEEKFFSASDRLPGEVAEALLDYAATGILPKPQLLVVDPYAHPDTLRRVHLVATEDELRVALDYPWEKWSVFLHPSQREIVEADFDGPARVTGSAGTGKTIVALHRAARAVREDAHARVLLTSFSKPLASALEQKLKILLEDDPAMLARVSVASIEDAASELYQLVHARRPIVASDSVQLAAIERAITDTGFDTLPSRLVWSEWKHVVDAWGVADLATYGNVPRTGRRGRMGSKQREDLWPVFERARQSLAERAMFTLPQLYLGVAESYATKDRKPYTHIIVDEAQDMGVGELKMMAALADSPGSLFFAGDLGQRIFQQPFSWASLGVDVNGRSQSLRINYRTSRQIRESADLLLPEVVSDADGICDDRINAQSVFDGPVPEIIRCADADKEAEHIAEFINKALDDGIEPSEIGVFVRSNSELARARQAVSAGGVKFRQLAERVAIEPECVCIGTMHFAKGLEFKAVVIMACDDLVLPLQSRIDDASDEDELREIFDTERHLFYVACTRARDRLLVSGINPASEFLDDLVAQDATD